MNTRKERRFISVNDLLLEDVRLRTFSNWSSTINKNELAKNGFFYNKTSDHVQCFFCGIVIGMWEKDDVVSEEHQKHSPQCDFIRGKVTGNVPLDDDHVNTLILLANIHKIQNTHIHKKPLRILHSTELRLETFKNWSSSEITNVVPLAEAGFYYTGFSDFVKCNTCGGGIFDWRKEDDPVADHLFYYPYCSLVNTKFTVTPPNKLMQFTDDEINLLLKHPIAKRLLDLEMYASSVKLSFRRFLCRYGVLPSTVTKALEVVYDFEYNDI